MTDLQKGKEKMRKNRGRFRSDTVRLKSWDYGWNGVYFVTICTHHRKHFFGEIILSKTVNVSTNVETPDFVSLRSGNSRMQLLGIGDIAESCWRAIPEYFPFVKLGEFIVMPNHVHGIIIINKENDGRNNLDTQNRVYQSRKHQKSLNSFGPQSRNLPSIIRGYKAGVTKGARRINENFNWQPKYYDHIIRDRKSFERISNYIKMNPENWKTDEYFNS